LIAAMISSSLQNKIQNNLNPILFGSLLIGIFCPGLEGLPSSGIIVIIIAILFLACTKIDGKDLAAISIREALTFYLLRFMLLPLILLQISLATFPTLANGVFLMALMPAGVASAALANLLGGSVSLALSVTAISTLLTPFIVPLFFELFAHTTIKINTLGMFGTLSLVVFLPIIIDRIFD